MDNTITATFSFHPATGKSTNVAVIVAFIKSGFVLGGGRFSVDKFIDINATFKN